ncbi:hypothetical protein K493DRAFT_348143 [Basidiobolus meristosporus CBS 931.73]|uniref:Uncharacterized protein n=1 Tax=Basidiobolus meristosporus CBS 931.73 TaxID=1314790 RepID=A0A1Y1YR96_9FUNG|nr:hypothetical protein K493DRAFT_348143 [Basidiobolus meristosporus CBS 931.73]|eukprot:ORY00085.1 hypothetical protein K493DRAFT_348143 [Basidiobolus meristosporus CBS 931.73]
MSGDDVGMRYCKESELFHKKTTMLGMMQHFCNKVDEHALVTRKHPIVWSEEGIWGSMTLDKFDKFLG